MITEETFLDFKCPYCKEGVSFPAARAGFAEECPLCMESLIVPKEGNEAGRALPFPMTTPRLILRRLRDTDWRDLVELFVNEETNLTQAEKEECESAEEQRVNHWLEHDRGVRLTTTNESFHLGLELQDGGKLIGFVTLRFTDAERMQAWVSATVNLEYQRKGLATEAFAGLLDFCFSEISLHRVTSSCLAQALAAVRVCEKVGMRKEGVFLQDRWDGSQWTDTAYFALLGDEYRASLNAQ